MRQIPVFLPSVCESALSDVENLLRSGDLNRGHRVSDLETEMRKAIGAPGVIAVNSCTSALHLSLLCCDVAGRDVITTPQTFVATGHSILMAGGRPVFADVERETGLLDPGDVESRITENTAAIVVVHLSGCPARMCRFREIEHKYGIPIVEDAAQALGACYKERQIGTTSTFACFSFQATKHVTGGDGGLITSRKKDCFDRLRRLRWFGIDKASQIARQDGVVADIPEVGFKYAMNDLAAAIALANARDLVSRVTRRRKIAATIDSCLSVAGGAEPVMGDKHASSSYLYYPLLVERRVDFLTAVRSRGVEAGVWFDRIDRHSVFGGKQLDLPGADFFNARQVALPCRENLSDEEVGHIIRAIEMGW